jgi:UV DNA damage endonuclease
MTVSNEIGIPIVFDYLHHKFCSGGLSEEQAFHLAVSTWSPEVTPVVHFSSAKKLFEDEAALDAAHADYIYERVEVYGKDVDVMLEAKAKELALRKYQRKFRNVAADL